MAKKKIWAFLVISLVLVFACFFLSSFVTHAELGKWVIHYGTNDEVVHVAGGGDLQVSNSAGSFGPVLVSWTPTGGGPSKSKALTPGSSHTINDAEPGSDITVTIIVPPYPVPCSTYSGAFTAV